MSNPGMDVTLWVAVKVKDIERLRVENKRLRSKNKSMHRALYKIAGKVPFADDPWTIARDELKKRAR